MKSISNLTESLSNLFNQINDDSIDLKKAGELNNTAGKILKAYQVQLMYHAMRAEAPDIPFLSADAKAPELPPKSPWKGLTTKHVLKDED